jgi:hypothetical protein
MRFSPAAVTGRYVGRAYLEVGIALRNAQRGQAIQASDFGTDLMLAECQSSGQADTDWPPAAFS